MVFKGVLNKLYFIIPMNIKIGVRTIEWIIPIMFHYGPKGMKKRGENFNHSGKSFLIYNVC